MQEIISCPSCQRKLQVPEALMGQDVQCPTCGATFVASVGGPAKPATPPDYEPEAPRREPRQRKRSAGDDDYEDDYEMSQTRRRRRDLLPHRGGMILTLGILSLLCGLGIILGPIAWIMGNSDMKEIRAGRMDPEGEGTTQAGRICGIIGTLLWAGILLLYCCIFILMGMSGAFR